MERTFDGTATLVDDALPAVRPTPRAAAAVEPTWQWSLPAERTEAWTLPRPPRATRWEEEVRLAALTGLIAGVLSGFCIFGSLSVQSMQEPRPAVPAPSLPAQAAPVAAPPNPTPLAVREVHYLPTRPDAVGFPCPTCRGHRL
jgi:hypothetical protein